MQTSHQEGRDTVETQGWLLGGLTFLVPASLCPAPSHHPCACVFPEAFLVPAAAPH